MKIFALLCIVLVVLGAIISTAEGYHKKKLKIKHVWKKGHKGYGKGHGYGKKLVGYSKRYQVMKHKGMCE